MDRFYGSIADERHLLPRERAPGTGRRVANRDDKGQQPADSPQPGRSRSPRRLLAAVAGLVLVICGGAAAATVLSRDGGQTASGPDSTVTTSAAARVPGVSSNGGTATASTAATDPPATAISLRYGGGQSSRDECIDLLDGGGCDLVATNEFDPLPARCMADGCQVDFITSVSIDGAVDTGGTYPWSDGDTSCGLQRWTLELRPVGTAVTRGIEHPARLVGEATIDADPKVVADANCIGRRETYVFDAVPI